jgi:hypothetical protein
MYQMEALSLLYRMVYEAIQVLRYQALGRGKAEQNNRHGSVVWKNLRY